MQTSNPVILHFNSKCQYKLRLLKLHSLSDSCISRPGRKSGLEAATPQGAPLYPSSWVPTLHRQGGPCQEPRAPHLRQGESALCERNLKDSDECQ